MDKGERGTRLLLEGVLILGLAAALVGSGVLAVGGILVSALAVHTLFWLFNGNFWALMQFSVPSRSGLDATDTLGYLKGLQSRAEAHPSIEGLALFGSVSRGTWHEFSDLDVRYVRRRGLMNLLRASMLVMRERAYAVMQRQPLDVFLADGPDFLAKMRKDECPVFLVKRGTRLSERFPENGPVCLIRLVGAS